MVRDRGIKAERRGKRDGERDKKNPEGREETFRACELAAPGRKKVLCGCLVCQYDRGKCGESGICG